MKHLDIGLSDVQAVYDGPEGKLWKLIMGEQVHVGGFASSMELAKLAQIQPGWKGLDLCCCLGGGMRFLAKNFKCTMCGVDASKHCNEESKRRAKEEGLADKLEFKLGDVLAVPYEDSSFDFVWGEDAWCYVADKDRLIAEVARLSKAGGTVAFTDWIEGPKGLSDSEAERINRFMKFPYVESLAGYKELLAKHGLELRVADDLTEQFAEYCKLYIRMLTEQLTYDALAIIGDDMELFQAMGAEMQYMADRSAEGKFGRGRFVAVKNK